MTLRAKPLLRGLLLVCLAAMSQLSGQTRVHAAVVPPNILFIVLDDVGKDQLTAFNPAATTAALTPNINAIIAAGVKFMNFWTMPECSPSRAAFFTGRYPLRNGVTAAILNQDLPAAHVSPYEMTTPKLLATAGYASALIGKYHLGGPENNPDGNQAPIALGWNSFNGNLRGGPPSIDASLGGQYTRDKTKYSCGFPTGAARGACWFLRGSEVQCDDNNGVGYTGQQGVALGGIPALDTYGDFARTCHDAHGTVPDFNTPNGYYAWPLAIADASGAQTSRSRQYMTTAQTDAAISWIRGQSQGTTRLRPWMATVSYNSIHTPYQQPPLDLYPPGFVWPASVPEDCANAAAQRVLGDLMLASMDREIGRLLVSVGIASVGERGQLVYRPEATDTMVVITGDNGTFLASVKPPYDPIRSKGGPYETGVSTPLIVSGPLVSTPGRTDTRLVNAVDLFQLFGEIAGVDVRTVVPSSHVLDSQAVLPYLTNPAQTLGREFNFTQLGTGLKPASVKLWPCVIRIGPINIATDILFTSESLCEDAGGTWFGPTADRPNPRYPTSCAIAAAGLFSNLTILPTRVWAIRNQQYKLVKVERAPCDTALGEFEFYDLSARSSSNPIGLDLASANLLTRGQPTGLTLAQTTSFGLLNAQLQALLNSERVCPGDGNLDTRVDIDDLSGISRYGGLPSVFDFNQDGVTDTRDLPNVLNNFGSVCR